METIETTKCKIEDCKNLRELYGNGENDNLSNYCAYHNETEEGQHKIDCVEGWHNFVPCDEWEPTCLYCGKFQS